MKINENIYLVASGKMGFDWTHPSDCNVYLLHSNDDLALIDTGTGASVEQICNHIEMHGFSLNKISKIFLTHIHADHVGGAEKLRETTGAKVYVYKDAFRILHDGNEDAIDLTTAKRNGFYPKDYRLTPCKADILIAEGDIFNVGSLTLQVLETPGHSAYDVSFLVKSPNGQQFLFSGDTVFYNGKISMLFTNHFSIHSLAKSVDKLSNYKVDVLLPGHYQPALSSGLDHIKIAKHAFDSMNIPKNIVE